MFASGLSGTQMYLAAGNTEVDGLTYRERADDSAELVTFDPFTGIQAFHSVLQGAGQSIVDIPSVDCSATSDPTRVPVDAQTHCRYRPEAVDREVFGVGMSFNGPFLFVGASFADGFDYEQYTGSVHVFQKQRGRWEPFQELKPKPRPVDGVNEVVYPIGHFAPIGSELFGFRGVDSEGQWFAAGAANDDAFRGATYVFRLENDPTDDVPHPVWVETQKITRASIPLDPDRPMGPKATRDTNAGWGEFPKFHGEWLFNGNYHSDLVGISELAGYDPRLAALPITPEAGALYVFRREAKGASGEREWRFHQVLVSPRQFDVADETHDGPKICEAFGSPIAPATLGGRDYVVVGASYGNCAVPGTLGRHGSAYVFRLNEATDRWEYAGQRLSINDDPDRSPICAENPLALVARPVFGFDNNLVIDGKWMAIGAAFESNCVDPDGDGLDADGVPVNTLLAPGVIYVYRFEKGQWRFHQVIRADGPLVPEALLGDGVDMKDGVIAASYAYRSEDLAPFPNYDTNEGAVVLFKLDRDRQWRELRRILGEEPGDQMGALASIKIGTGEVAAGHRFSPLWLGNIRNDPDRTEAVRIIPFDVDDE